MYVFPDGYTLELGLRIYFFSYFTWNLAHGRN